MREDKIAASRSWLVIRGWRLWNRYLRLVAGSEPASPRSTSDRLPFKMLSSLVYAVLLVCPGPAAAVLRPEFNVVLISLNALRADHLKIYGYGKETAPNISGLAGEGVVFERAVAQSHWTLSSLASLFTSKYVHSHGLYERGQKLSESEITLAEALKEGGYTTAAFTGGLDTSGMYGLAQGFDVYFDDTGKNSMGSLKEIMPRALDWLAARMNDRFFLFLDSYDIHPPFDKPWPDGKEPDYAGPLKGKVLDYNFFKGFKGGPPRLTGEDLAYVNSRYDAGVTYADGFIGKLLAGLSEMNLSTSTIVIITAEHGEELGDHGGFDRFGGGNLYDEAIRVPLIIKLPGKELKGARVSSQAQLIDIMPTILDLAGLRVAGGAQGKSLLPLIPGAGAADGKDFNRYVYSEAGPHKWAVRSGDWKLIYDNGKYALFDLTNDKAESENAAVKNPSVVYELAQKLMEWRRKTRTARSPDDTRVALTEEMKRKLREAGYWR